MSKKTKYLNNNITGIKNKIKIGNNTRIGFPRNHIYKVIIKKCEYWKFHIKRQGQSQIKYFTTKKDAKLFLKKLKSVKNYEEAKKWYTQFKD
jgi:hypothetical protein